MKTQNLKFGEAVKTLAILAGMRPYTVSKEDEIRARVTLTETDLCNGDHNILRGDPSLTTVFGTYSPANGLIR